MRTLNQHFFFALISFGLLQSACNSAGVRGGIKVAQEATKQFAKNAGKNSTQLAKTTKQIPLTRLNNGRVVASNQAKNLKSVHIPQVGQVAAVSDDLSLGYYMEATKNSVLKTSVDLVLFDAKGNAILYADEAKQAAVYAAANRAFRNKLLRITEDVLQRVSRQKVSSEKQLLKMTAEQINSQLGTIRAGRPAVWDIGSGQLTLNMTFANNSQIIGSVNMYKLIKQGVTLSALGYYTVKKSGLILSE